MGEAGGGFGLVEADVQDEFAPEGGCHVVGDGGGEVVGGEPVGGGWVVELDVEGAGLGDVVAGADGAVAEDETVEDAGGGEEGDAAGGGGADEVRAAASRARSRERTTSKPSIMLAFLFSATGAFLSGQTPRPAPLAYSAEGGCGGVSGWAAAWFGPWG